MSVLGTRGGSIQSLVQPQTSETTGLSVYTSLPSDGGAENSGIAACSSPHGWVGEEAGKREAVLHRMQLLEAPGAPPCAAVSPLLGGARPCSFLLCHLAGITLGNLFLLYIL